MRFAVGLAGYLVTAAAFFAPLFARFRTHILSGDGWVRPGTGDAFNFLWNYWWTQTALGRGKSPFFCDWVLPPTGLNLFFDTHLLVPTVATWPLAALFGPTAGYNAMVVLLIVGGAAAAALALRRVTEVPPGAAWVAGLLFGFSPYFLNKAHGHLNMIGSAFWVGIPAILLYAYARRSFTARGAAALAVCCALTFWTSVVEFFMAAIVCGILVVTLEWSFRHDPAAFRKRIAFVLPSAAVTVVSVLLFRTGGTDPYTPEVFAAMGPADVFSFSRLSVLYAVWTSGTAEFGGVALPFSMLALMIAGALTRFPLRAPVLATLAVLAVLMMDVARVPSGLLRLLPFAEGFRVFPRFFAFFLFFGALLAAVGFHTLRRHPRGRWLLIPVALAAVVEIYPAHLAPGPVRGAGLAANPPELDRTRNVLLFPDGPYLPVHDTYQVNVGAPFVLTSNVAHRSQADEAARRRRFPILYDSSARGRPAEFLAELQALNVEYLLFENRRAYESGPVRGGAEAWPSGEYLIRVSDLQAGLPR